MRFTGDSFIKAGFWSQLVLIVLLDWASLVAFSRHGAAWYHVVGFVLVNVLLLGLTAYAWRWLRGGRRRGSR
jgi:hypothetical protein